MKIFLLFCISFSLLFGMDERSREEIENENLKLRVILEGMKKEQGNKKIIKEVQNTPNEEVQTEKKSEFTEEPSNWLTATSFGFGFGQFGNTHRLEQFFIYKPLSDFSLRTGLNYIPTPTYNELEGDMSSGYSLIFGLGYNLFEIGGFFVDLGLDYIHVIENPYENATLTGGTTISATDVSGLAYELGLGYSFGSWSIRTDFIISSKPYTLIETRNEKSSVKTIDDGTALFSIAYWW